MRNVWIVLSFIYAASLQVMQAETPVIRLVSPAGFVKGEFETKGQYLVLKQMNRLLRVKADCSGTDDLCALPESRISTGCNLHFYEGTIYIAHDQGIYAVMAESGKWSKVPTGLDIISILGISSNNLLNVMSATIGGNASGSDILNAIWAIDCNGKGRLLQRNNLHPIADACYCAENSFAVASGNAIDLYSPDLKWRKQIKVSGPIVDMVGLSSCRFIVRIRHANRDSIVNTENAVETKIADGKYIMGVGGGRVVAIRDDNAVVVLSKAMEWLEIMRLENADMDVSASFWGQPKVSLDGRYVCLRIGTVGKKGDASKILQWGLVIDLEGHLYRTIDLSFEEACWVRQEKTGDTHQTQRVSSDK